MGTHTKATVLTCDGWRQIPGAIEPLACVCLRQVDAFLALVMMDGHAPHFLNLVCPPACSEFAHHLSRFTRQYFSAQIAHAHANNVALIH